MRAETEERLWWTVFQALHECLESLWNQSDDILAGPQNIYCLLSVKTLRLLELVLGSGPGYGSILLLKVL